MSGWSSLTSVVSTGSATPTSGQAVMPFSLGVSPLESDGFSNFEKDGFEMVDAVRCCVCVCVCVREREREREE